ncbi:LarC family nickel insertion protein [Methylobacterium sp. J-088]|uniref:LarC family nickel insertion protein n=1 Tax=unclassified Methylobacterium TaxID=2615210 RepID=UPI001FBA843E|nr:MULTISPECIES: LarC family nickel insertion protein [unclassified Methylobacterium]MCJ2067103.1 LarC family nickel insertion protein [Methylobacterium sp. J-088]
MHIHLDALGGVAGDMFAAALLDAFPEHQDGVSASIRAVDARIACALHPHNDGILRGARFFVSGPGVEPDHRHDHGHHHHPHHDHDHTHGHTHDHGHRPWSEIRAALTEADLAPSVRAQALGIFGHLADAEARVHGIAVDAVAFHEVGAFDSIADIVAAAHLIAALEVRSWSVSALPLGSGRVKTQHGPLPVPAPATTLLLAGFSTLDDGVPGERVTPTGAAILRHLCGGDPGRGRPRGILGRTGIGFGTKVLPGLSNCLRALVLEEGAAAGPGRRDLAVIAFEIDDQSGEDLAMGLDCLRAEPGILDVVQAPVLGKKGRMMAHIQALVRPESLEAAIAACFRETTTIGLRYHLVEGAVLDREAHTVEQAGRPVRVKVVDRPGGRTAKAEADDSRDHAGHAARAALRRAAERLALDQQPEEER